MSGPYDQGGYGGQTNYNQYPQQPNYAGADPNQQYQNQGGYGQAPYGQQQGYGAPPARSYAQGHQQQQGGYGGPPQQGGFQHGQQQPQYDQGQYSQQQYSQQQPYDANQGGPWGQGPPPSGDPANPYGYNRDPQDPNNPQEGERGFLGAVGGGIGGHMFGKSHGHGLIGTLAGAFLGSKAEDKLKNRHSSPHRRH